MLDSKPSSGISCREGRNPGESEAGPALKPSSSLRCLIGGNPAGATRFVASYLTFCGYPTSHEAFYCADGKLLRNPGTGKIGARLFRPITDNDQPLAECSYTVGEWMNHPDVIHLPVICILRNPLAVLNSLMRVAVAHSGLIDPNQIMKEILSRWERLLARCGEVSVFRVEFDLERLVRSCCAALELRCSKVIPAHVHNEGRCNFRWEDFGGYPECERFREFAERFDYV